MPAVAATTPLWLVHPQDILAHLFFAVGAAGDVLVSGRGVAVEGSLRYPDGTHVIVAPSDGPRVVPLDAPVCVAYASRLDQYRFFTRVRGVDAEGMLLLDLPRAVERRDRRLTERFPCPPRAGYGFRVREWQGAPVVPVHDISAGGIGLVSVSGDPELAEGELVDGDILVPGEDAIPVCLEVRHARPSPFRNTDTLVGARITAIATVDRARLSRHLAWRSREP